MSIRNPSALRWYTILLIVAAILALGLPPSPGTLQLLHISTTEYRIAVFTLILPYAVIWFAAFFAYAKLKEYAKHLLSTREGAAFKKIADGLTVMAWGLALPTILTLLTGALALKFPALKAPRVVTDNYIALLIPVISFTLIGNGTRALIEIVKTRPGTIGTRVLVVIFVLFGVLFSHLVLDNHHSGESPYYLSTYPLILTVIVPYLYAWFAGLLSAYELVIYAQQTKGFLYQKALNQLAGGIIIVIIGSISAQFLTNAYASRTSASFPILLGLIYCLLIVQAAGFAMIAWGAKRLKRIEEV